MPDPGVRRTRAVRRTISLLAITIALPLPALAQSTVELPARDTRLDGAMQTVFAIGKAEGQAWETFSNVPAVAFDKAANLYVLDRDNARIVVFDRTGKYLRQIGRKGEGPGELGLPLALAVTNDDRVVVFDLANNALTVFKTDGSYQTVVRPPSGVRARPGSRIFPHPSGGVVLTGSQLPDMEAGPGAQIRETLPLVLVPLDGGAPRTLYEAPSPPPMVNAGGSADRREVRVMPPPAFSPEVSFATLPDGRIAVSHGAPYAVRLVGPQGVASVLSRPISPRTVSERDKNAAKEQRRQALRTGEGQIRMEMVNGRRSVSVGGGGMPEQAIERMLGEMTFAETIQVVRGVRSDADGRIWVRRDGGPGQYDDGPIDIVTADGKYVGSITGSELPYTFGPNGLAAFIETGEYDVPRVVVRHVPATWK